MDYEYYNRYSEFLKNFIFFLKTESQDIIFQKTGEKLFIENELSLLHKTWTSNLKKNNFQPSFQNPSEKKQVSSCQKCFARISYKTNQFTEENIKYPYLILIYDPIHSKKNQFFQDEQKDILFKKVIDSVFQVSVNSFLVRDIIKCNFNENDKFQKQKIYQNCIENIEKDIEKYSIQGILCFSKKAVNIMFEKNKIKEKVGKVFNFLELPTVISPGIDNLVELQKNNYSNEEILKEKKKIFSTLQLFQKKVLQWK